MQGGVDLFTNYLLKICEVNFITLQDKPLVYVHNYYERCRTDKT